MQTFILYYYDDALCLKLQEFSCLVSCFDRQRQRIKLQHPEIANVNIDWEGLIWTHELNGGFQRPISLYIHARPILRPYNNVKRILLLRKIRDRLFGF